MENELRAQAAGRESRIQKLFLAIVEGFAARGQLDSGTLAARPGSEAGIFKHAAGLAEVAYQQSKDRF